MFDYANGLLVFADGRVINEFGELIRTLPSRSGKPHCQYRGEGKWEINLQDSYDFGRDFGLMNYRGEIIAELPDILGSDFNKGQSIITRAGGADGYGSRAYYSHYVDSTGQPISNDYREAFLLDDGTRVVVPKGLDERLFYIVDNDFKYRTPALMSKPITTDGFYLLHTKQGLYYVDKETFERKSPIYKNAVEFNGGAAKVADNTGQYLVDHNFTQLSPPISEWGHLAAIGPGEWLVSGLKTGRGFSSLREVVDSKGTRLFGVLKSDEPDVKYLSRADYVKVYEGWYQ